MYQIEEKVVQAMLNYLAQRPYAEVAQLISILSRLEKITGNNGEVSPNGSKKSKKNEIIPEGV